MPNTTENHVMIDIEALGRRPGCAIFQISAQVFNPHTGELGTAFNAYAKPDFPFTIDPATLAWHKDEGTFPHGNLQKPLAVVFFEFSKFISDLPKPALFWAWGGESYDFPILQAAFDAYLMTTPWNHWETRCARTFFKTVFGDKAEATPKNHDAAEDVRAQIKDLLRAFEALKQPQLVTQ